MNSRIINKYLIITFTITFFFWGLDGILSFMGMYTHPSYSIGLLFYIIAVNGPFIATIICLKYVEYDRDNKSILAMIFPKSNIGIGVILVAVFLLLRFVPIMVMNSESVDINWLGVIGYIPIMIIFGGLEEIGWRGFLQPRLEEKFGFIVATCITATFWIAWHIPLRFIEGTYQYSNNFTWFMISLIGSAFSLAIIRKISNSIVMCIGFHAIGNAVISNGVSNNSEISIVISAFIQVVIAIIIYIIIKKNRKFAVE